MNVYFFETNRNDKKHYQQNILNKSDIISNSVARHKSGQQSLTIFHQNVCGINSKKYELEIYLDNLENKPQFICLSEHFLNDKNIDLFNINSYNLKSYNTRVKMTRGGSLILGQIDGLVENL